MSTLSIGQILKRAVANIRNQSGSTGSKKAWAKRFTLQSRRARLAIVVVAFALYVLAFFALYPLMGLTVASLAVLPVLVAGWLLGMWAGLLAGVLFFPLNLLLLNIAGQAGWAVMTGIAGGALGTVLLIVVGGITGRMSDLSQQVARELAARQEAETDLVENEERFRLLADNARDAIYRMSLPDGRYEYFSPAATEIFGYAPQEWYDTPGLIAQVIHPDWQGYFQEQWGKLLEGEMPPFYEYQIIHKSGQVRWLNQRNVLVRDIGGRPIAIEGIVTDITERKKTEEVLRACLRLSEFALSHSLDELLTRTLDDAEALTGSQMGFFHFLETDQKTLWLQSWSTNTLQKMCTAEVKERHYPVDKAGVWVDCIRERRSVIHNDYASLPASRRKGLPDGHAPVTRELVVPIIRGEQIMGVLGIGNKPGEYGALDIEIVSRLANLTWDIVLSKQAAEEIATRVRQQTTVVKIGQIALAGTDVQMLMDKAVALVAQTLGVEYCKVLQLSPDGSVLKLVAGVGWEEELVGRAAVGADRDSQAGFTLRSDQPVIVEDLHTETRFTCPPLLRDHGVVSGMSVVIRDTHQPFGVLGAHTTRRRRFTQDDVNFLQSVANILAEAVRRYQAEQALREREARYSTLFNAITDALFVHEVRADGSVGKFVQVNDVACQHLGYTRQELLNLSPMEIDAPDSSVDIQATAQRVVAGESVTVERTHVAKDGRRIPVEIHAHAFKLNTQPAVISLVRDITERKQAEKSLAQTHEQLRALTTHLQSAIEAERAHIAREIHDDFGQSMSALKMDLTWLANRLPEGDERVDRIRAMTTLVDESIALMRRIATELRPGVLDDLGLNAALEWQAQEFSRRSEISCNLKLPQDDLALDPALNTTLFRIFQETLTNVARHAQATRVDAMLQQEGKALILTVQDNGRGITEREIKDPRSLGLLGLRERAARWRGDLTIHGATGKGTTVTVRIPLPASPVNGGNR